MKFTVDVDCTPEEARAFLGLPDVAPMQAAMMKQIQDRMAANLKAMDADALFKTWMPVATGGGMESLEQMQRAFFAQFSGGGSSTSAKKGKKE